MFVELDDACAPTVLPPEIPAFGTTNAIDRLVRTLPPMERACVLLKDVLDLSLEGAADVVGGVKSALHRGRARLETRSDVAARRPSDDPALVTLLERYVALFNQQNWTGTP